MTLAVRKKMVKSLYNGLIACFLFVKVLILLALSFMSQRKRLWPEFLWGLPGIVIPVNLLTYTPRRFISVVIFAMMSGDILKFFFRYEDFVIFPLISNCYGQIIVKTIVSPLLLIAYISVKFFPLLGCVNVVIPVLGPALGLIYALCLISYDTYNDVFGIYCDLPVNSHEVLAIFLSVRAPLHVATLITLCWFSWKFLASLHQVISRGFYHTMLHNCKEASGYLYYTNCVKHLLKRKSSKVYETVSRDTLTYKVVATLFPFWFSPKRLPLKFFGAIMVATFMIYQFSILFFGLSLRLLLNGGAGLRRNRGFVIQELAYLTQTDGRMAYNILTDIQYGLTVVIPAAPVIAMLFCFVLLYHLYITVYKNIVDTAKGNYTFPNLWPTLQLSYSWRYPGYQIAFAFTAFIIYTCWLWFIGGLGIVMYFALQYFTKQSLCSLAYIIIPILWITAMIVIQLLLAKLLFIEKDATYTILTNKRVFHWVSYFLFIYDAISGLLTAIFRALMTQVLSLLLMIRLDRIVLMKGFEFCDVGYKAYVGFLYLNHIYNNAVVHSFLFLLSTKHLQNSTPLLPELWSLSPNSRVKSEAILFYEHFPWYDRRCTVPPVRSVWARNRWFVAYTLIRNPRLKHFTARNMAREKNRKNKWRSKNKM